MSQSQHAVSQSLLHPVETSCNFSNCHPQNLAQNIIDHISKQSCMKECGLQARIFSMYYLLQLHIEKIEYPEKSLEVKGECYLEH